MTSKPLFGRVANVLIGEKSSDSVLIEEFRFTFSIRKTDSEEPNTCVLNIYNLNVNTRNSLSKLDDFAFLSAGYKQANGAEIIFVGNITDITTLHQSPEVITQVTISDGEKVINSKKVSVSYKAGAKVQKVLDDIVKGLDIPIKTDISKLGIDKVFNTGFSHTGTSKNAIKKLSEFAGLDWSIQNNEIKFTKIGKSDGSRLVSLDQTSGLIKVPEKIKVKDNRRKKNKELDGWKITSLLQPKAEPGGEIVVSSTITGANKVFKIIDVQHDADTFEGNFQTVMSVIESNE